MPITLEKSDVLSHLGEVPDKLKAAWHKDSSPQTPDGGIHGCFSFFGVAELCWDISENYDKIVITLKVAGAQVGRWVLDTHHTTIKISGNQGVFKEELDLTADFDKRQLKMKGKACYWAPFKWHCKSFDVVLVHW